MTERDYMNKLSKQFNTVPGCKFRIMPDTGGLTHRKPYDAFIIFKGLHISVEGKVSTGKLEDHQVIALAEDYECGAGIIVVRFCSAGVSFIKYRVTDASEEDYKDIPWKEFNAPGAVVDILLWMVER